MQCSSAAKQLRAQCMPFIYIVGGLVLQHWLQLSRKVEAPMFRTFQHFKEHSDVLRVERIHQQFNLKPFG